MQAFSFSFLAEMNPTDFQSGSVFTDLIVLAVAGLICYKILTRKPAANNDHIDESS